ncbi:hypothetical protein [Methylobacter sp. BBA5.1]|uniref:hypothetical protein n=1 Tax=Methylobacter sp. BBA5.1 TaxID=1495064 RepID=UPI00055E1E20|nr:hypothetical protein [Methylobacter sp. BBA5.1]
MKNQNIQDKQYQAAHVAALNAIIKQLGKNADREQALDVVLVMAHNLLTHEQQLDVKLSTHNGAVFYDRLKLLIETTQKNIHSKSYAGRLM